MDSFLFRDAQGPFSSTYRSGRRFASAPGIAPGYIRSEERVLFSRPYCRLKTKPTTSGNNTMPFHLRACDMCHLIALGSLGRFSLVLDLFLCC